jgi:1,4-alpha-glucan branching enzyme
MQGSPQENRRAARVRGGGNVKRKDRSDAPHITRALDALLLGTLNDPFAVLGRHGTPDGSVVRAFFPGALGIEARAAEDGSLLTQLALSPTHEGVFTGPMPDAGRYVLRIQWPGGVHETEDPYAFGPLLSDLDLHLFSEGTHWDLPHRFGANVATVDGVEGVRFAVWAPNARRVSLVGDFNSWDTRRNPMRLRHTAGVWELFVPRLKPGERYKYDITAPDGAHLPLKADPLARATEPSPATASVVARLETFAWNDAEWMATRACAQAPNAPISIYEVHAGSWMRPDGQSNGTLDWHKLASSVIS